MKERVTLTIEESVLRKVDSTIDGQHVRNRSHAVELLLREALQGDLPEVAVILAGGTDDGVKEVCRPIEGKPIVRNNVQRLVDSGITNILIITTDPDTIKKAVGSDFGDTTIRYISETSPMGTGGALHLAKPYLKGPFVLTNGDEYSEVPLREMLHFHNANQGFCTIALTTVNDTSQYGVALLNGSRIITFVEKPDPKHAPSKLISAGVYIMDPQVLELLPDGYAKIEYDLFPKLAKQDMLYGYPISGKHITTNNS